MNVRPTDVDHELSSSRVSAKSRFSAPPSAAFHDYGNNDNFRATSTTKKSKVGINGRSYEDDDDDDELTGLSSKSSLRSAAKRASSSGTPDAKDLRRQRSTSSAASASKDRPWRTASAGSAATDTTRSSSYATAKEGDGSVFDWGSSKSHDYEDEYGEGVEVASPARDRWAQYETDDLAEESRKATSNATLKMATKLADGLPSSPMGGSVGTGYGHDEVEDPWAASKNGGGDMEALTDNGNSLPPAMDKKRSDTDYVKSRLSKLVPKWNSGTDVDYERNLSASSEHDRVRDEALKMLQIADDCLSPRNSAPNSPRSSNNAAAGLFRTAGGGLAMRELHTDEVDRITVSGGKGRDTAGISGLDRFQNERTPKSKFNGTFSIGSKGEEDLKRANSNGNPVSPNEDTPSMWSSRYSVERQLMAITGGLDSNHLLAKMDMLHSSREKTKSARGMYRASGYAMDGSHEEYNDYSRGSSMGLGLGGIYTWLKGTLWSDLTQLNDDGTTQSLVRREKAIRRRRLCRFAALFFVGLSIAVGVLVHLGNPNRGKAGDVNFYVLADEPYDFSNVEQLTRELEALPADAEFVVHLGNANGDEQSRCQEYGFERAAAVLKESPVPVLVIPGPEDWAACGSERAAQKSLQYWDINLGRLEKHWNHPLNIEYSDDVVGNFAFLHKGVLFVSVNIIDVDTEPNEVTTRLEQNVIWTKAQLAQHDASEYHAVVLFGHAPPSEEQGEYFWPIAERIKDLGKPVMYLHANADGPFERYVPYSEAENFAAVQLEKQGLEAPMKVVVREGKEKSEDSFVFERRDPTMERIEK